MIPENLTQQFAIDQWVILDKEFSNYSYVQVVNQTPGRLYTRVKSEGVEWEVMTYRLQPARVCKNCGHILDDLCPDWCENHHLR